MSHSREGWFGLLYTLSLHLSQGPSGAPAPYIVSVRSKDDTLRVAGCNLSDAQREFLARLRDASIMICEECGLPRYARQPRVWARDTGCQSPHTCSLCRATSDIGSEPASPASPIAGGLTDVDALARASLAPARRLGQRRRWRSLVDHTFDAAFSVLEKHFEIWGAAEYRHAHEYSRLAGVIDRLPRSRLAVRRSGLSWLAGESGWGWRGDTTSVCLANNYRLHGEAYRLYAWWIDFRRDRRSPEDLGGVDEVDATRYEDEDEEDAASEAAWTRAEAWRRQFEAQDVDALHRLVAVIFALN
jgi:hypothetical protein